MRIGRVVEHAPGCSNFSFLALHRHTPSPPEDPQKIRASAWHTNLDDVQGHLVVPAWVSRDVGFEPGYSAGMLGSFQSGKGVGNGAEFEFNKMNIPV
eukprot:1150964-Pelagomonas_calceolata.AAC.2